MADRLTASSIAGSGAEIDIGRAPLGRDFEAWGLVETISFPEFFRVPIRDRMARTRAIGQLNQWHCVQREA